METEKDVWKGRERALTMSFSQFPSGGLEVEKNGGLTLTSKSVGRCSFFRCPRPPPNVSSEGDPRVPLAIASSRRRRKRRRRKIPRTMIAEEMASRRKSVARNVNLVEEISMVMGRTQALRSLEVRGSDYGVGSRQVLSDAQEDGEGQTERRTMTACAARWWTT